MFLIFIAEYPFARFFFGIPAWAIGAVVVGIQVLQYLGNRAGGPDPLAGHQRSATAASAARSFGLGHEPAVDPQDPEYPARGAAEAAAHDRAARAAGVRWSVGHGRRRRTRARLVGPHSPSRRVLPTATRPKLDELLDKISGHGMDGLTTARSGAWTSSPSACASGDPGLSRKPFVLMRFLRPEGVLRRGPRGGSGRCGCRGPWRRVRGCPRRRSAAAVAALGAEVDDPVGRLDHVRWCSMTTTVLPASTTAEHGQQPAMSSKCSPVVGSSRM